MKDNNDVELLQWLNKIIKDSFTYLPPGKNHFFLFFVKTMQFYISIKFFALLHLYEIKIDILGLLLFS